ncbi:MAG: adenylate/guanylate cyclase domain-containing protein [Cyclobacteriaceae bacterium]
MNRQNIQSTEEKLLIKTTVLIEAFLALNTFLTGLLLFYYNLQFAGLIGVVGSALFTANLIQFGIFRNWLLFRVLTILIGLILPPLFHVAFGGYVNSGGVLLWGVQLILWAVVIEDTKLKYFWITAYILTAIGLAFWEHELLESATALPTNLHIFLILNLLVTLSLCVFIVFDLNQSKLKKERVKSENLLLNILPKPVAYELKETGKAAPKKYENVTILFTDFRDFTKLVASIPATKLVAELNDIFSRFDDIMEEFEVEKIETIGDAYMAACGLPKDNPDHALRCVEAALSMVEFLDQRNKNSGISWDMRVGIHSGPVVAGVVGKKKFAYDLFGDTINTASRIESNGQVGKVNISQTTYELLKQHTNLIFEDRGLISAKGKGELQMRFVYFKSNN